MSNREEKIRMRAHEIWEMEGRPDGQDQRHWERAVREIGELPEAQDTTSAKSEGAQQEAGSSGRQTAAGSGGGSAGVGSSAGRRAGSTR